MAIFYHFESAVVCSCSRSKHMRFQHKAESPLGGKMSRYEKLNQSLLFAARIFRRDRFE